MPMESPTRRLLGPGTLHAFALGKFRNGKFPFDKSSFLLFLMASVKSASAFKVQIGLSAQCSAGQMFCWHGRRPAFGNVEAES